MGLMIAIPPSASVLSEHVPRTFCTMRSHISLTYLNACNKALIKTNNAKLKRLRLALLKQLLIFIIISRVIIFNVLPKIIQQTFFNGSEHFLNSPTINRYLKVFKLNTAVL
jgi:hypothetical protein